MEPSSKMRAVFLGFIMLATMFCNTSAVVDVSAIVEAAAEAVSAGSSLADTTLNNLMDTNYKISCGIEIENWTRYPLIDPDTHIFSGALTIPPTNILPSSREAMVSRKQSDTATGTSGTVSWLIEHLARRIVIMWSVPYDLESYSNWLGLGITVHGVTKHANGDTWFNQMYYEKSSDYLGFSRGEYYKESKTLIYMDDQILISGTMGTGHHPQVKITIRPLNVSDLSAPIKAILEIGLK